MTDLLVHIGRSKTGTTAVQRLLADNPGWLREQGYYLPATGFDGTAHHTIARTLSGRLPALAAILKTPAIFAPLGAELEQQNDLAAVITSEAFQGCRPWLLRRCLGKLEPRVIVYIRNQLEYLVSSYNQRVHATAYAGSIERYYARIYHVNYARFLGAWSHSFPGGFTVRKFEGKALEQQDVVADFIRHGLNRTAVAPPPAARGHDPNPSLNARVLLFKLHLNRTGAAAQFPANKLYRALPRLNGRFAAERFRLPQRLKAKVVRRALQSDRQVARRYFGETELFDYAGYQGAAASTLGDGDIEMMTRALLEEMER